MKLKQTSFIKARKNHLIILSLLTLVPVFVILLSLGSKFIAEATHNGDTSLIHICKDTRGRVTIVGDSDSCNTGETEATWLKDVIAGSGITITRSSNGATIALTPSQGVTYYESGGTGLSSPDGSWQDVTAIAQTHTFAAGTVKATFTGSIRQTNGDGTAYIRFKVQKTGDSPSYVGDTSTFRASSPSTALDQNIPFTAQKVITVTSGEYTITPQVNINNSSWGLYYQNSLIVEQ